MAASSRIPDLKIELTPALLFEQSENALILLLKKEGGFYSRDKGKDPKESLFADFYRNLKINGRCYEDILVENKLDPSVPPSPDDKEKLATLHIEKLETTPTSMVFTQDQLKALYRHYSQGPSLLLGGLTSIDVDNLFFISQPELSDRETHIYSDGVDVYFKGVAHYFPVKDVDFTLCIETDDAKSLAYKIRASVEVLMKLDLEKGFELLHIKTDSVFLKNLYLKKELAPEYILKTLSSGYPGDQNISAISKRLIARNLLNEKIAALLKVFNPESKNLRELGNPVASALSRFQNSLSRGEAFYTGALNHLKEIAGKNHENVSLRKFIKELTIRPILSNHLSELKHKLDHDIVQYKDKRTFRSFLESLKAQLEQYIDQHIDEEILLTKLDTLSKEAIRMCGDAIQTHFNSIINAIKAVINSIAGIKSKEDKPVLKQSSPAARDFSIPQILSMMQSIKRYASTVTDAKQKLIHIIEKYSVQVDVATGQLTLANPTQLEAFKSDIVQLYGQTKKAAMLSQAAAEVKQASEIDDNAILSMLETLQFNAKNPMLENLRKDFVSLFQNFPIIEINSHSGTLRMLVDEDKPFLKAAVIRLHEKFKITWQIQGFERRRSSLSAAVSTTEADETQVERHQNPCVRNIAAAIISGKSLQHALNLFSKESTASNFSSRASLPTTPVTKKLMGS